MNIQTKYNIGDKVFTIDTRAMKIIEFTIDSMYISVGKDRADVFYTALSEAQHYKEECCFATKHELLTFLEQPREDDQMSQK